MMTRWDILASGQQATHLATKVDFLYDFVTVITAPIIKMCDYYWGAPLIPSLEYMLKLNGASYLNIAFIGALYKIYKWCPTVYFS